MLEQRYERLELAAKNVENVRKSGISEYLAGWEDATMLESASEMRRLREALFKCRDQFQFYASEHARAGKREKAATNQQFVFMIAQALGSLEGWLDGTVSNG